MSNFKNTLKTFVPKLKLIGSFAISPLAFVYNCFQHKENGVWTLKAGLYAALGVVSFPFMLLLATLITIPFALIATAVQIIIFPFQLIRACGTDIMADDVAPAPAPASLVPSVAETIREHRRPKTNANAPRSDEPVVSDVLGRKKRTNLGFEAPPSTPQQASFG